MPVRISDAARSYAGATRLNKGTVGVRDGAGIVAGSANET